MGERLAQWGATLRGLVFEWPSPLFEAHFWGTTLAGLRIITPLLLWGVFLAMWVVRRGHGRVPEVVSKRTATVFTVFGFLLYYGFFNPNIRNPGFYEPAAFYHQYLGVKYEPELEAVGLVDCTLAAEKELGKTAGHGQRHVYRQSDPETLVLASSVAAASDPTLCSARFTKERWDAFRSDVQWFQQAVKPDVWSAVQRARPEVMSPGLRMLLAPFLAPAASEGYFRALALLAPLLHVVGLVAVRHGFGPVSAALLSITWGCQPFYPFAEGLAPLGNVALVAWLVGLSCWRRGYGRCAGLTLALGMCLEPTTLLGLVPIAAAGAARFRRRMSWGPPYAAVTFLVVLVAGLGASTRAGSYAEYRSQMELRSSLPALSDVGLSALFSNRAEARYRFQRDDVAPDPAADWTVNRGRLQSETRHQRTALVLLVTALVAFVAWQRRSLQSAAAWGWALSPLLSQPIGACLGFIPLALAVGRRHDLSLVILAAVAGANVLVNQLAFADDRAAAITALLWVTTLALLTAVAFRRLPQQRRAVTPGGAATPNGAVVPRSATETRGVDVTS